MHRLTWTRIIRLVFGDGGSNTQFDQAREQQQAIYFFPFHVKDHKESDYLDLIQIVELSTIKRCTTYRVVLVALASHLLLHFVHFISMCCFESFKVN